MPMDIPGWSPTDTTPIEYLGSSSPRPPMKPEWGKNTCYVLGPDKYGSSGPKNARWWAVHFAPSFDTPLIYLTPTIGDGTKWGKTRIFNAADYGIENPRISACFDNYGRPIIALTSLNKTDIHHSFTTSGQNKIGLARMTFTDVRSVVVGNILPTANHGDDVGVHVYLIANKDVQGKCKKDYLYRAIIAPGSKLSTSQFPLTEIQLAGPSVELESAGYRVDNKFQLKYSGDLPEIPDAPEYDSFELVSPPFKYVKVVASELTYGSMGNGLIKDTEMSSVSDTVAFKGPALASINVKQPQMTLNPVETYTPVAPKVANIKVTDPNVRKTLPDETLSLPAPTVSVKVDKIRVNSSATDTMDSQHVTISNVSLITL